MENEAAVVRKPKRLHARRQLNHKLIRLVEFPLEIATDILYTRPI